MTRVAARLVTAAALTAVAVVPAAPADAAECGDLALVCAVVCAAADKYTNCY